MEIRTVPGGMSRQFEYFNSHGRLVLFHAFADDYEVTGRMKFVVRFINDGDQMPWLGITYHMYLQGLKCFVHNSPVTLGEIGPAKKETLEFEVPPMNGYDIELEACIIRGDIYFPGYGAFSVGDNSFELQFQYSKLTSNRIEVHLT